MNARPRTTAPRPRSRSWRDVRSERGVVLVEFAMCMTLLLTLGLGIYEFGFAWRSAAAVTSVARSGARTSSSLATDDSADYQALSSVRSDLQASGLLSKLQLVVIYRSNTSDGDVPVACTTNTSTGALCDVYTGDQVRAMLETDFDSTGCMTGMTVANYCPAVRNPIMATADYVGVWVKIRHDYQTGLFGGGLDITKFAVMRIEPRVA